MHGEDTLESCEDASKASGERVPEAGVVLPKIGLSCLKVTGKGSPQPARRRESCLSDGRSSRDMGRPGFRETLVASAHKGRIHIDRDGWCIW